MGAAGSMRDVSCLGPRFCLAMDDNHLVYLWAHIRSSESYGLPGASGARTQWPSPSGGDPIGPADTNPRGISSVHEGGFRLCYSTPRPFAAADQPFAP